MITKPACNDAVMHHGFVWLVLKVRLPTVLEVRCRPRFELFELLFSGSNLHAGFNSICSERPGSVDMPLFKYLCIFFLRRY